VSDAEKIAHADEFKTIQEWRAQIWAEGYAAAREQAAEAVEEVKRIYVDASNSNSAGPLLDEAAAAIRKMEPNT